MTDAPLTSETHLTKTKRLANELLSASVPWQAEDILRELRDHLTPHRVLKMVACAEAVEAWGRAAGDAEDAEASTKLMAAFHEMLT